MTAKVSPAPPMDAEGDLHRTRELALAAVVERGPAAVAEQLLAALDGDQAAAGLSIGPLLRALSGVDWLSAHDLMLRAGIPDEATPLGVLDRAQRSALAAELAQLRHRKP